MSIEEKLGLAQEAQRVGLRKGWYVNISSMEGYISVYANKKHALFR